MPKALDLRGQRFGRLTVLDEDPVSRNGNRFWHCRCDCGNDTWVRANILKSGKTQSCGCLSSDTAKKRYIDLRGQRFGRLTVLDEEPKSDQGKLWHCRCDCGNELWVRQNSLQKGNTQSCGCLQREMSSQLKVDLRGRKFGRLTVLNEEPVRSTRKDGKGSRVFYHVHCDCGSETWVLSDALLSGHTQSCGCLNRDARAEFSRSNYVDGTSINNLLQQTPTHNRSGYKNVSYDSRTGKFRAAVRFKGKNYILGSYEDPEEASNAAEQFREQVIYPFLEDKTIGIKSASDGRYEAFWRDKSLGVFDSLEDANKARIKEAALGFRNKTE